MEKSTMTENKESIEEIAEKLHKNNTNPNLKEFPNCTPEKAIEKLCLKPWEKMTDEQRVDEKQRRQGLKDMNFGSSNWSSTIFEDWKKENKKNKKLGSVRGASTLFKLFFGMMTMVLAIILSFAMTAAKEGFSKSDPVDIGIALLMGLVPLSVFALGATITFFALMRNTFNLSKCSREIAKMAQEKGIDITPSIKKYVPLPYSRYSKLEYLTIGSTIMAGMCMTNQWPTKALKRNTKLKALRAFSIIGFFLGFCISFGFGFLGPDDNDLGVMSMLSSVVFIASIILLIVSCLSGMVSKELVHYQWGRFLTVHFLERFPNAYEMLEEDRKEETKSVNNLDIEEKPADN